MLCTGGSGGGSAAAGGQGQHTSLVGPAPEYGSLYLPHEYGGNGGLGGGASVDSRCTPHVSGLRIKIAFLLIEGIVHERTIVHLSVLISF